MTKVHSMSAADHDRVSAAVTEAERHCDGEIVTIITQRSDSYHDAGLQWAIGASFLLLSVIALRPAYFHGLMLRLFGGWEHDLPAGLELSFLLGAMILVFLIVRYALAWMPLRLALTPGSTKARRVRRRAIAFFRAAAESRTKARTAILIYLSMDEHRAEIVADAAINTKVQPEIWGDAMAALIDEVRAGRPGHGLAEAIRRVGIVLAQHFPKSEDDINELPDRLIEL